ncbi:MAG: hypothetical protein OXG78_15380 [Chloroflexi bacterium]|nr:hypothetical protein [Chloroflexota bacterium]
MTSAELQSPRVHALAAMPGGQIFCAKQSGLQRSSDNGRTWRNITEPAPTTAICVMDDGCIFVATVGAVQISDDAGASWHARALPSQSTIVSALLATEGAVLAATLEDGVLRSDDGGRSWRGWNVGLLNWRVNALCRDSEGTIWAGAESGLFRSDTDGRSWQDQSDFVNSAILSLAAAEAGRLWLGTTEGALHSRLNQEAGWALAHQWQSPINAICTIAERTAVLHGETVSASDGESVFKALPFADVTGIEWLNWSRLLIATNAGSVQIVEVP